PGFGVLSGDVGGVHVADLHVVDLDVVDVGEDGVAGVSRGGRRQGVGALQLLVDPGGRDLDGAPVDVVRDHPHAVSPAVGSVAASGSRTTTTSTVVVVVGSSPARSARLCRAWSKVRLYSPSVTLRRVGQMKTCSVAYGCTGVPSPQSTRTTNAAGSSAVLTR